MRAIDGNASLPVMAAAMVAAAKAQLPEDEEKNMTATATAERHLALLSSSTHVRVGLSTALVVILNRDDAARSEKGWTGKLEEHDDHVLVTVTPGGPSMGCAYGKSRDDTALSWLRSTAVPEGCDVSFRTVQGQVIENNEHRVVLRVMNSQMRPPVARGRHGGPGKAAKTAPLSLRVGSSREEAKAAVDTVNSYKEKWGSSLELFIKEDGKLGVRIMEEW